MTFIKKLREAERTCSNVDYRAWLNHAAFMVEWSARKLAEDITESNMQALNGAWANAARILKNVPPEAEPSPTTGGTEPTKFAIAA